MIVKDKEKVSQPIDASLHYKMYKDGKHWVTAGITTLMFSGLILGTQTTAHADTANASTSGNGQAQATTGGNAVTQTTAQSASTSNANTAAASQTTANTVSATAAAASTATQSQSAGTITQPVAVDHSQLDQAVAAAKQAGLNPQQQPTTSSTVAPSEVESAKANIESDYASQAAKLQEAADQQQTINKYNGSKGDTSALDAAVKEAQNTPGLTVTQDQTKTTTLKANDKSGIANWSSSTATDYASQVDAINKAIAAQKQKNAAASQGNAEITKANEEIKAEIEKIKAAGVSVKNTGTQTATGTALTADKNSQLQLMDEISKRLSQLKTSNSLSTHEVVQNLNLGQETSATLTVQSNNSTSTKIAPAVGEDNKSLSTYAIQVQPTAGTKELTVTATYSNLNKSSYTDNNGVTHKIAKIVAKYHAYNMASDYANPNLQINQQPQEGFWYNGFSNVDAEYTFYDENGQVIKFGKNAWLTVLSLNSGMDSLSSTAKTGDTIPGGYGGGWRVEGVNGDGDVNFKTLDGSTVTVHNDGWAYSDGGNDRIAIGYGKNEGKFAVQYDNDLYEVSRNNDGHWKLGKLLVHNDKGINWQDVWDSGYEYWDDATRDSRYAGATVGDIKEGTSTVKLSYVTSYANSNAGGVVWAMMSTIIPPTPAIQYHLYSAEAPSTSSVSYHYNVANITPGVPDKDNVSYQYHNLNVATTPDKNWTQGDQVVNGKTEINDDTVSATVKMDYQKPSNLVGGLTKLSVGDNYAKMADKVTYQGAQVYENDTLATSQYNVTNNAADATVTATRKDASTAPGGTVSLVVDFKVKNDVPSGTKLVNFGSGTINNSTVPTKDVQMVTYNQTAEKHWMEGTQTVDGKTYINDDVVTTKVDMSLPDPSTLAHPLTNVTVDDDYSDFQDKVTPQSYRVEENGKDVTSEYNVTYSNGHLTAVRKTPSTAPAGKVSLIATWLINANVASGTKLTNRGSGRINNHTVPTNTPDIKTYTQTAEKHWVEGSQTVDDKTYVDGDEVHARVEMSLPDPSTLAKPLTDVTLVDNYSDYADKVDYQEAHVYENGVDVTSEYNIVNNAGTGTVTATRKDASSAPKGTVVLTATWKVHDDVASGTKLINGGSGTIDNDTVPTPNRTIVTYKQDTDKHWVSGGQNVDGKVAINGDNVTAQVNMTLPDKSKLGGSINKVQLTDDFSKFAKDVTVQAVHVYENGIDVSSEYNIAIDPNGKVVATRKNPSKVNTAGNGSSTTVTMKANMKAADSLDASSLVAKASGNVNGQTSTTKTSMLLLAPTTDIAVENGQVKSQVNMSLPSDTSDVKNFAITDDYSNFSNYADASEVHVYENGTDATSKYAVTDNDGKVTATRKDMSDAKGGNVTMTVDYKLNHDIPNGTVLENHGSGTLNNETVPTNTPSITTYTQTADKHWVEGTQTVDGKVYVDGTVAHAQVTTSLPDPATLTDKLTDVSITDDYSAFADKVDFQSAQVLENGKDATDQYTITKQGDKITATRKNPGSAPAGNAQLLLTFKIHSDVPSGTRLENVGSSTINNHTVSTNKATITTFKPDPKKDVVVSVDNNKSLNGANIDLNSLFDYKLEGSTVPKNSNGITEYGFHDDYDQEHDQYNGGYTVLLNSDVTLTDSTVLKKGTDVTKYTTQTIDQDNGIIDIEFDQDFLTKVDYAKSEFGATAYLKMKRVKAGDVENKYVNSINNQAFNSNTVKTHTDEPKPATPKNETPTTPQATTPQTPLSPKTSQQPVFAAVQPAALQTASQSQAPSQGQQQLPQTGNDKDEALALTGLASLLFGLGTLGMKKRRRHA